MPLFGAWIADSYLGRYKTIQYALGLDVLGHIILIISSLPPVIKNTDGSLAALIMGKDQPGAQLPINPAL
jgi:proton-dependent oligopeptide transporter, POT family